MEYNETPEFKRISALIEALPLRIRQSTIDDLGPTECLLELVKFTAERNSGGDKSLVNKAVLFYEKAQSATSQEDLVAYLAKAFGYMAAAFVDSGVQSSRKTAEIQAARMRALVSANAAKGRAIERARAIAAELWGKDTAQVIRIGDMSDRVYRKLAEEGFAESLPGGTERIKKWISPAAPDYARKGGKPRKPHKTY